MPGPGNPIKSIYKYAVCNLCTNVLDNLGGSLNQAWLYHELALLYDALYTYAGFVSSTDSYAIGELLAAIKAVMAGIWQSKPEASLVESLKDTLAKVQIETGCVPVPVKLKPDTAPVGPAPFPLPTGILLIPQGEFTTDPFPFVPPGSQAGPQPHLAPGVPGLPTQPQDPPPSPFKPGDPSVELVCETVQHMIAAITSGAPSAGYGYFTIWTLKGKLSAMRQAALNMGNMQQANTIGALLDLLDSIPVSGFNMADPQMKAAMLDTLQKIAGLVCLDIPRQTPADPGDASTVPVPVVVLPEGKPGPADFGLLPEFPPPPDGFDPHLIVIPAIPPPDPDDGGSHLNPHDPLIDGLCEAIQMLLGLSKDGKIDLETVAFCVETSILNPLNLALQKAIAKGNTAEADEILSLIQIAQSLPDSGDTFWAAFDGTYAQLQAETIAKLKTLAAAVCLEKPPVFPERPRKVGLVPVAVGVVLLASLCTFVAMAAPNFIGKPNLPDTTTESPVSTEDGSGVNVLLDATDPSSMVCGSLCSGDGQCPAGLVCSQSSDPNIQGGASQCLRNGHCGCGVPCDPNSTSACDPGLTCTTTTDGVSTCWAGGCEVTPTPTCVVTPGDGVCSECETVDTDPASCAPPDDGGGSNGGGGSKPCRCKTVCAGIACTRVCTTPNGQTCRP